MTAGDEIISRTRTHCCDCGQLHDAAYRRVGDAVVLEVDCPQGRRSAHVSSDAAIFGAVRARSAFPAPPLAAARGISWINFLEITSDCNCRCPVCYADARPGGGQYISLAEVETIARRLRSEGILALSITGGEPTLHPQLLEIIRTVRRQGLDATLISNGLILGRDPDLGLRLRQSGLTYLYLQLDTLRPQICLRIRGDELVDQRQRALRHAREAGLNFGLDVTIVRDNLEEVGALLEHATRHAPRLNLVTLLTAGRTGRFELPAEACVTREDVIAALVRSGAAAGLTARHAWPFPRFAPLGLDVHPDCGVLIPLALDAGRLRPLDEYVDLAGLFRRMAAAGGGMGRARAAAIFSAAFLRSVRPRRLGALTRMLAGLASGRGASGFLTVVVEQFVHERHQDEQRLERCTTCVVLRDGSRVPLCRYQHADPRRAAHTRVGRSTC